MEKREDTEFLSAVEKLVLELNTLIPQVAALWSEAQSKKQAWDEKYINADQDGNEHQNKAWHKYYNRVGSLAEIENHLTLIKLNIQAMINSQGDLNLKIQILQEQLHDLDHSLEQEKSFKVLQELYKILEILFSTDARSALVEKRISALVSHLDTAIAQQNQMIFDLDYEFEEQYLLRQEIDLHDYNMAKIDKEMMQQVQHFLNDVQISFKEKFNNLSEQQKLDYLQAELIVLDKKLSEQHHIYETLKGLFNLVNNIAETFSV